MFLVTFANGKQFQAVSLVNSGWKEINQPITKLEYNIYGLNVCLQGYESYNHLIECNVLTTGQRFISKIILEGKMGGLVERIVIYLGFPLILHYIDDNSIKAQGAKVGVKSVNFSTTRSK